ncbi:MAG: N-acetylneuraminate synthase family protein [Phycisphaerales bacterium]|nr:N-acetylneuraminate synthase family protein [Phycisphaerales bacterium]
MNATLEHPPQDVSAAFRIGDHQISAAHPAYVIAEAGVNHDADVNQALRLIDAAVEAGADAVKFQVFTAAEIATSAARKADYQQGAAGASQRDMLSQLELSDGDFARLRSHCEATGIHFLATPFSETDVRRLLRLAPPAIKTASTDLNNHLLMRAVSGAELPLIVSTGAATADEIDAAVDNLTRRGARGRVALLHCVSCYPTPLEAANLGAIPALAERFRVPVGYSDHTTSVITGALAVSLGAVILEKHFTLDRNASGPDHSMSLDPAQLAEYTRYARDAYAARGCGAIGMQPLEREVRAVARKSLVARVTIPAGALITRDMLTAKRPSGGIQPDQIETVIGQRARIQIAGDEPLQWDMLA